MTSSASTGKRKNAQLPRLFLALIILVLGAAAFSAADTVAVSAASSKTTGMKQPSDKTLANYVKKYVTVKENKWYPDENDPWHYSYSMNTEAIAALPVADRAKVVATMEYCWNNYFSSEDGKTAANIEKLSQAYDYNNYDFISSDEAADYFAALSGYVRTTEWRTKDEELGSFINAYISGYRTDYIPGMGYENCFLESYNQVLDMFTVIDGKIKAGSKRCVLVCEEDRNIKVGSKTGKHHVKVFMVTKPGTVKYKSLNTSTGKKKTFKTKYISLASAIDKEQFKILFTDAQKDNMLTVSATTMETARKLHETLSKGREQLIRVDASEEKAKEIIAGLGDMVAEVNGGGYEFMYDFCSTASDSCAYALITEDYGNVYSECGEFYSRLEKQYKDKAAQKLQDMDGYEQQEYYREYLKYPDEKLRTARQCYDALTFAVFNKYDNDWGYQIIDGWYLPYSTLSKTVVGYEQFETSAALKVLVWYEYEGEYCRTDAIIRNETDWSVELYSFDEFLKRDDLDNILEEFSSSFWGYTKTNEVIEDIRCNELLVSTSFKDLSDAAKLYAIDVSGIFDCVYNFPSDGRLQMVYTAGKYGWDADNYADALKDLINGKADGVCQVYAMYEELVFRTLGFECYNESSWEINHAWTVVRVSNRAGKELWVPFDYGIGPAKNLSVSEEVRAEHLQTEKMRYDLYLKGVEGAPRYKNFTMHDFAE